MILSSTSGYHRIYEASGQLYFQSGTAASADSRADINFTSMYASTNYMKILGSNGNVGIGTTSPDHKLHIYANDTSNTQLILRNNESTARTGISLLNAAGQYFNIQHVGGAGLGSNAAVIENFSTTNGGIEFYNKGDGEYTFRTTDSNNLRFSILNNGNVGVGGITPSSKLHVDGDVRMKTLSTNAIGEITPVYVRGTGNNNNANRIVRIGDTTHVDGTGRGLTLTIINASTHAHVSSTNYDTYGSQGDSNNLATALEGMTDAQIGILTSHDAFEDNMTGNLITACFKLGLTRLAGANDDNNRHPYCAIFYGLGDTTGGGNHAIEVMKADRAGSAYATLSTFLVDDSFMGQTVTNALYSGTADNTTPTVFVNKDKNVGIGTTTFTDTRNTGGLHIQDNRGISFSADSSQSNSRHWRIRTDDYSDWGSLQISVSDNNSTHPDASDEHVMTMTRDRRVGIGTASPGAKLEVNGSIRSSGGTYTIYNGTWTTVHTLNYEAGIIMWQSTTSQAQTFGVAFIQWYGGSTSATFSPMAGSSRSSLNMDGVNFQLKTTNTYNTAIKVSFLKMIG
jgi:hypothetical protein